jgi:hypothetical protein
MLQTRLASDLPPGRKKNLGWVEESNNHQASMGIGETPQPSYLLPIGYASDAEGD